MAKKINTTVLGVFVVGAVILALTAVVLFGSGQWFKPITRYVVYFPESVQGLKVGADVKSHGVKIGSVVEIEAVFIPKTDLITIPVYIDVDRSRIKNLVQQPRAIVEQQAALLKAGLRAQLITESFVTGQRAVALSFNPESPERLVGLEKRYPEIPSLESSIEKISTQLESLPIDQIVGKLDKTLTVIANAVDAPEFSDGLKAVGGTMTEVKKLVESLNADLPPMIKSLRQKVDSLRINELSNSAEKNLASLEKVLREIQEKVGPIGNNTNKTLAEISAAARELRQLAELLQRQPEAILKGKK